VNARRVVTLALALLIGVPGLAAAAPVAGAQVRYWSFSNDNDMRDGIVYWAPGPFHVQLEQWDFERGQDQFRPEVGLHLRDRRRSVYTLQWRHERDDERAWIGTEQVLGRRWVARGEVSPLFFRDSTTIVWDLGADVYFGSYGFAGATLVRDPREGGLWVVPVRVRLASERNDWLQLTVAPASRRTVGWAVDAKWGWLRAGVERNSRFDFTTLDNTIFTAGVEVPIPDRH
jgi:hypothetical protein